MELGMLNFTKIREKYRIPEGVRLIYPAKADRPCSPPLGHIAMMADAFECGMRLPLHPFFRAILHSYNLCHYQLSLNFWTQSMETWLLWQEVSLSYPMSLYVFHTLVELNKCAKRDKEPKEEVKDSYYLTPRGSHSPIITGHPSPIKHWMSQWLCVAGD
ncbi:uncharacterized protein Fot_00266 [Forsythia ovata]|uniref:Transposase (putative) gypsy type domain-containing protein n=1 Tax=Forsythia ovata TaxID=205694 RepID=A0ABD1X189_9LAMI